MENSKIQKLGNQLKEAIDPGKTFFQDTLERLLTEFSPDQQGQIVGRLFNAVQDHNDAEINEAEMKLKHKKECKDVFTNSFRDTITHDDQKTREVRG